MKEFLKKKWHIILYFICVGAMFVAVFKTDNKGIDEKYKIHSDIDFSKDWNYEFEDGASGTTNLPNTLPKNSSKSLVLTKTLPTLDKDMEFIYRARHVEIKIYVGDELRVDTCKGRTQTGIYYEEVPLTTEDSGKEIRIEANTDVSRYLRGPGSVYLGDRGSMFIRILRNKWKTLFFTVLLILLSVVLFILWALNTFVLHKRSREVLCLALFSVGVAIWIFTESDCSQFLFGNTGAISVLAYEVLALLPVPIALFFSYYSDRPRGRIASNIAATVPVFLFIIVNVLEFLGIKHLSETLIITQVVLAAETVAVAIIQIIEIKYKYTEKEKYNSVSWKIPILGIAILVPLAMVEVVKYVFFSTKYPNDGVLISIGVFFYMLSLAFDSILRIYSKAEKYKENSEVKTQFLASMSHEIRTPLNAILGFNEVILRTTKEEKTRNHSADIQQAGENLKSIINSILDISKIESGKLEIYEVEYSTIQIFDHLSSMFEAMAKKKGLNFFVDIDSRVPEVLIGDENHLRQVLVNIMSNAVKYTPEGSVHFTVKLLEMPEDTPICKLYFSVKDTGIGIKDEDKGRLFEKFERLDREKNYSTEGTGLGMSIVVQLLRAMGSEIELDSVYGVGSDFHFTITQSVVNKAAIGSFIERRKEIALANDDNADFIAPDAKILIVDDVQMNLDMVTAVLEELHVQITTAKSGKEAIEKVKQEKFDLVLMDHMMPEMDGIEATECIRNLAAETENVYYAELPILALTANAMVGMKERFFIAGMQDFVSKPIEVPVLYKALEKWLPKDKIKKLSRQEREALNLAKSADNKLSAEWDKLPDFVNSAEVTQFCMNYELFIRSAKGYFRGGEATKEKILEYNNQRDEENYRITVHGLKSTSKMIGLTEISNKALDLERKCLTGNFEEASNETEAFIDLYDNGLKQLGKFLIDTGEIEAPKEDEACSDEEYIGIIERIKTATDSFDMGAFIALEEEMNNMSVPADKKDEFEKIKQMVTNAAFGELKDYFSE